MKIIFIFLFSLLTLFTLNASADAVVDDVNLGLKTACKTPALKNLCQSGLTIKSFSRSMPTNGIAHYEIKLQIGSHKNDIIVLHRLVKIDSNNRPIFSSNAVMLLHGDALAFTPTFFATNNSLAMQMVNSGMDVWGMDSRWTSITADTSDLNFMSDWNMGTEINDVGKALTIARLVRIIENKHFSLFSLLFAPQKLLSESRMSLVGFSRGGQLGYAYLSEESQRPAALRHVKSFVPMDIYFKTNDPAIKELACQQQKIYEDELQKGIYANATGLTLSFVALAAQLDPEGATEIPELAGLNNLQAAVVVLASPPADGANESFHYNGGSYIPELPFAIDLAFSDVNHVINVGVNAAPYQPNNIIEEGEELICDKTNSPYDDYLSDIEIPIHYVYAAGGMGEKGLYSAQLTGSRDITSTGVQLLPNEYAAADFGHLDLLTARNAKELVWTPMINWIKSH